ncbi:hypothetical protein DRN86_02250 [Candidatus Geothermarchaeota archaeon]|nr:MAG: hypothetical protein DRN86_02250 [Candidatus Geothermarchaeota archaeon]
MGVVMNRSDLISETKREIMVICDQNKAKMVGEVPFDEKILRSSIVGKQLTLSFPNSPGSKAVSSISNRLREILNLS